VEEEIDNAEMEDFPDSDDSYYEDSDDCDVPKKKINNFSPEDMYTMINYHYGSVFNLFGLGGPGTYVFLGPTESGKTWCIKQMYAYATSKSVPKPQRVKLTDIIVVSATAKINDDYEWNPDIVKLEANNEVIKNLLAERIKECREACEALGKPMTYCETWGLQNPIMIISDDTYGSIDMITPGNASGTLATMARHFGIYFIIACQYVKQCGPLFKDNARMWVCFSTNKKNHRLLVDWFHGVDDDAIHQIRKHNAIENNIVVYVTTWHFKQKFQVAPQRIILLPPVEDASEHLSKRKRKSMKESRYKKHDRSAISDSSSDSESDLD